MIKLAHRNTLVADTNMELDVIRAKMSADHDPARLFDTKGRLVRWVRDSP